MGVVPPRAPAGDPLRAWGYTDLVGAAIITHHGARGMGAVTIIVVGELVSACSIPPVVIVVEVASAQVAAIVVHQAGWV